MQISHSLVGDTLTGQVNFDPTDAAEPVTWLLELLQAHNL